VSRFDLPLVLAIIFAFTGGFDSHAQDFDSWEKVKKHFLLF